MRNLCIDRVSKHFGNVPVLRDVDCSIEHGEFIGVVGPSGCGKTTLLRLIAGLEDVSEGETRIDGKVVNDFMPRDRNIAMVFQNYALYPHKTVYENLAYSLRLRKAPRDEITSRVKWAAEVLQIESLLQRRPSQLSGGQRQRVAMGRAIVRQPSVFLFDEPLSNLDANLRSAMRIELRKLHVRLGITSVYVTHDQTEAMTLADRLIVLRAGQIEQFDIPAAIYDRPASSFVGRFIGSPPMNLIRGIVDEDARMLVVNGGASVRLPSGYRLRAGQEVTIGVRPERLRLGGNGLAVFDIRVELLEMLGADSFLHGALATRGGDLAIVARVDRHCAVSSGERVSLNADPVDMHLFDARSDRRIEAVAA